MAYVPNSDWVQSVTDPTTGAVSYTYDSWGDRVTMQLPGGGTWTYGYDYQGNWASQFGEFPELYEDGDAYVLGYWGYPKAGDLDSLTQLPVSITDDQSRQIDINYDTAAISIL